MTTERLSQLLPNVTLTDLQKQHINSVFWLFSPGGRRTGRTYLLAVIMIAYAYDWPGTRIPIRDHANRRDQDQQLIWVIRDIVSSSPVEEFRNGFKYGCDWIEYSPVTKVD